MITEKIRYLRLIVESKMPECYSVAESKFNVIFDNESIMDMKTKRTIV